MPKIVFAVTDNSLDHLQHDRPYERVTHHDRWGEHVKDCHLLVVHTNFAGESLQHLRDAPVLPPIFVATERYSVETCLAALRYGAIDCAEFPSPDGVVRFQTAAALVRARMALRQPHSWCDDSADFLASGTEVEAPSSSDLGIESALSTLSTREREVLRTLAAGLDTAAISTELCISPHTVRSHLKSIFRKLEVNSQLELLAKLRFAYV